MGCRVNIRYAQSAAKAQGLDEGSLYRVVYNVNGTSVLAGTIVPEMIQCLKDEG
jgi:hypothetical protein